MRPDHLASLSRLRYTENEVQFLPMVAAHLGYSVQRRYADFLERPRGVADEWVTQLFRQGDAKVLKKYSQMKLQMKREALAKLNRQANGGGSNSDTIWVKDRRK